MAGGVAGIGPHVKETPAAGDSAGGRAGVNAGGRAPLLSLLSI
ncbi:hypothetical protein ACP4OV_012603 [Aristida adscensionis]